MFIEIKENSWINTAHVSGVQILQKVDTKKWHVVFHLAGTVQSLMSGSFSDSGAARRWLEAALFREMVAMETPEKPGSPDKTGFGG